MSRYKPSGRHAQSVETTYLRPCFVRALLSRELFYWTFHAYVTVECSIEEFAFDFSDSMHSEG